MNPVNVVNDDLAQINKEREEAVRRRDELRQEVFDLTEEIHKLNRAEQKIQESK